MKPTIVTVLVGVMTLTGCMDTVYGLTFRGVGTWPDRKLVHTGMHKYFHVNGTCFGRARLYFRVRDALICQWLVEAAQSKAWKTHVAKSCQLSLF